MLSDPTVEVIAATPCSGCAALRIHVAELEKALDDIVAECEQNLDCSHDESDEDFGAHVETCVGCTITQIARAGSAGKENADAD